MSSINPSDVERIEQRTIEVYNDIHPYVDIDYTIDYYLKTIGKTADFFKDKTILDCGFGGTGWASELFCRAGARSVCGVELNPTSVKVTNERLARYACHKDLRQGNVLSLPYPDDSFDYVHSHGVMHHTVDWKKGVSEMVRVLKPGGVMYLGMYAQFGPVGRASYGVLRALAKLIPYKTMAGFVKRTGFLRHSEYSILDLMYVPVEEHLTDAQLRGFLAGLGQTQIVNHPNHKWENAWIAHPLLFGRQIHHAFVSVKPG